MIDCAATTELGSPEYMARFTQRAMRDHVPVSGSFDLTYRCNLRCSHCYAGHLVAQTPAEAGELPTAEVLSLLAEAAEAGCLNMVWSGGEPLLRPDFVEVYRAGCRLGILTTVFTNATLVDHSIASAFVDYPPRLVEVSMYGSTAEVYERITGVRGSYERALRGIGALLDAGVHVGLKTMILRDSLDDVSRIEALADDLGVTFRLDPLVTPRLDGDPAPLAQRVDPAEAAAVELSSPKRLRDAATYHERVMSGPERDSLYQCGAGRTGFYLDPRGTMLPCLMSRRIASDARSLGFGAAWDAVGQVVAGLQRSSDSPCIGCESRAMCGYCPALFALETGSADEPPSYVCRLGEQRLGIIEESCEVGRE